MNKEDLKIYKIPANFSSGISVMGNVFPVANVAQSIVICAVLCLVSLGIFSGSSFSVKLSAVLCSAITAFTAGLTGIYGMSVFKALLTLLVFIKTKGVYSRGSEAEQKPVSGADIISDKQNREKSKIIKQKTKKPEDIKIPMRGPSVP